MPAAWTRAPLKAPGCREAEPERNFLLSPPLGRVCSLRQHLSKPLGIAGVGTIYKHSCSYRIIIIPSPYVQNTFLPQSSSLLALSH